MSSKPSPKGGIYLCHAKRGVDVLGAGIAILLLVPLFLAVALAIRLFDPGPVLFAQLRSGHDGRDFVLYKFRSMPVDTAHVPSDQLGQIRISAIGRFIRRTSLDELPQLYNILKGDMSLVGPRPALPVQRELLQLRQENGAIKLRPGLTGLAQVEGHDGMSVPRKAALDGQYASRITFLGDLHILSRTLFYPLRPPPTY